MSSDADNISQRLRNLGYRQLQVIDALANAVSMADTAKALDTDQSSVSRTVAACERALDAKLFDRRQGRSSVQLTNAGRIALPVIRDLLSAYERLLSVVEGVDVPRIRLSCFPAHVCLVVGPAIKSYRRLHPDTVIDIEDASDVMRRELGGDLRHQLDAHAVDIIIAPTPPDDLGLEITPLYKWSMLAFGLAPHIDHTSPIDMRAVAGMPILCAPRGHVSRRLLDDAFESAELPGMSPRQESESVDTLLSLARAGEGVAVLPSDAVPNRVMNGLAIARLVASGGDPLGGRYSVVRRQAAEQSADSLGVFVQAMLDAASTLLRLEPGQPLESPK